MHCKALRSELDKPFSWDRFFTLAEGLVGGINTLHSRKPQILHREIRPQNLLVGSHIHMRRKIFWVEHMSYRVQVCDHNVDTLIYNTKVSSDWKIKFCDFGRARYNDKVYKKKRKKVGPFLRFGI